MTFSPLVYEMLIARRIYIINKVKAPMRKALVILSKRYPEPNRKNVAHPNSNILLDIVDRFFKFENNPGRKDLFKAIFRVVIAEYEHDPYYRQRIDWFIEQIVNSEWKPRSGNAPYNYWLEPFPRGGNPLISDKKLLSLSRRFEELEVRV